MLRRTGVGSDTGVNETKLKRSKLIGHRRREEEKRGWPWVVRHRTWEQKRHASSTESGGKKNMAREVVAYVEGLIG